MITLTCLKNTMGKNGESPKEREEKSQDEASFTLVSYQLKAPACAVTQKHKKYQEVTKGKFYAFQRAIYPIIGKILEDKGI
jgi:hypothetical protein